MSNPVARPIVLVLMGVSGCGKTTVAAILAGRLGWPFEEGDALHPPANVEKMNAGHPLTDDDRAPWLEKIADWVDERLDAGESGRHHVLGAQALVPRRDRPARRGRDVRLPRRLARDHRRAPGRAPRPLHAARACWTASSPTSRSRRRTSLRSASTSARRPPTIAQTRHSTQPDGLAKSRHCRHATLSRTTTRRC